MVKLIKFEKEGCVPCQMVQNFLDENNVEVEKVNPFDKPELAVKYSIGSIPVVILLDDKGEEVSRTVGFKPDELESIIENL